MATGRRLGGLLIALALPWLIYPPVAMDIVAWALFAVALDLLLGFTGLLSFGHAAFWGTAAYTAGTIAIKTGVAFPIAFSARQSRRWRWPCRSRCSQYGVLASTSRW